MKLLITRLTSQALDPMRIDLGTPRSSKSPPFSSRTLACPQGHPCQNSTLFKLSMKETCPQGHPSHLHFPTKLWLVPKVTHAKVLPYLNFTKKGTCPQGHPSHLLFPTKLWHVPKVIHAKVLPYLNLLRK